MAALRKLDHVARARGTVPSAGEQSEAYRRHPRSPSTLEVTLNLSYVLVTSKYHLG